MQKRTKTETQSMGCMSSRNLPPVDSDKHNSQDDMFDQGLGTSTTVTKNFQTQQLPALPKPKPCTWSEFSISRPIDGHATEEQIFLEETVLNSTVEQSTWRTDDVEEILKLQAEFEVQDVEESINTPPVFARDLYTDTQALPTKSDLEAPLIFSENEEYVLAKTRSGRVGSIVVSHEGTNGIISGRLLFKPQGCKPEMRTKTSMSRVQIITT